MGAWTFVAPEIEAVLDELGRAQQARLRYIGRPAVGFARDRPLAPASQGTGRPGRRGPDAGKLSETRHDHQYRRSRPRRIGHRGDRRQVDEGGGRPGASGTRRCSSWRPTRSRWRSMPRTAGRLGEIRAPAGATVEVGAVVGVIAEATAPLPRRRSAPAAACRGAGRNAGRGTAPRRRPRRSGPAGRRRRCSLACGAQDRRRSQASMSRGAAGSGKDGRLTKADAAALAEIARETRKAAEVRSRPAAGAGGTPAHGAPHEREERVRMSRLRKRIAERLKQAQNTAAMLTTFNEVDMSRVMALRAAYKEAFEKKHGVKLGFMSFFVKAAIVGAEGDPGGQWRDRRRRHRLQEPLRHRRGGGHRAGPGRAGGARCRSSELRRDREDRSPISASARATASSRSTI